MTDNNNEASGDPKKERSRQEASVLADFMKAMQRKVQERIASSNGFAEQIQLSDKEMQALNRILVSGKMEGLIASVATFVVLRRFPKYLRQRAARQEAQQRGGGYTLDPPPGSSPFHPSGSTSMQPSPMSGAPVQANLEGGFIWRSFQFTLDVVISMLVGLQTAAYMMDREGIKRTLSEIPLMEGNSGVSDQFCGVLVEEYKRQWNLDPLNESSDSAQTSGEDSGPMRQRKPLPPFDRKDILKNPNMDPLQVMIEFAKNCAKRQALERRIRQERGMAPNESVSIPFPGVNSSEWNSEDADEDDGLFLAGADNGSKFDDGEKYLGANDEGGEWTKDDIDSFVSDQEDSKK